MESWRFDRLKQVKHDYAVGDCEVETIQRPLIVLPGPWISLLSAQRGPSPVIRRHDERLFRLLPISTSARLDVLGMVASCFDELFSKSESDLFNSLTR